MTNRWQRTHRSIKIPNVKLRPAPTRVASETYAAEAEDDAHFRALRDRGTTHGAHAVADFCGDALTPLRGTVLSFTGIAEKRELSEMAEQLGARVCANLTSDVTHLVARVPGSAKYHAAVQFRMDVVRPEWLYAVREAWLAGDDDVDIHQLAMKCRLSALEGLTMALTGAHALEREALERRIEALGARIAPKLVWDGSITHLVCVGDDAERPRRGLAKVLALRQPSEQTNLEHTRAALQIRLVHGAWVDDCERTGVLLPEAEYDALQPLDADARRARIAAVSARPLERTHSAPSPPEAPAPAPSREDVSASAPPRGSLLAYSREARFAAPPRGVFASRTFYIDMGDEARTKRVAHVVRRAGGTVWPATGAGATETADYAVGPLARPLRVAAHTYVTHHWVERCLYDNAMVDPSAHVALRPATETLPNGDAAQWRIALTGIARESPDYFHTCAAIEALGGTVVEAFSRQATHLLCGPSAQEKKVAKAAEWHIPTITTDFLERALRGQGEELAALAERPPQSAPTALEREAAPAPSDLHAQAAPRPSSPRPWTRTPSSSTNYSDQAADAPRRRARPRRHGARPEAPRLEATLEPEASTQLEAPMPTEPLSDQKASHVWYDDPAARREQTRLLALVDELAAERPSKRVR